MWLVWRELGAPPVERPIRPGFGMLMLTQLLPHGHRSGVAMEWPREGLVCTIRMPVAEARSIA
jgi:two-component sensor histidine kinase